MYSMYTQSALVYMRTYTNSRARASMHARTTQAINVRYSPLFRKEFHQSRCRPWYLAQLLLETDQQVFHTLLFFSFYSQFLYLVEKQSKSQDINSPLYYKSSITNLQYRLHVPFHQVSCWRKLHNFLLLPVYCIPTLFLLD